MCMLEPSREEEAISMVTDLKTGLEGVTPQVTKSSLVYFSLIVTH